MSMKMGFGSLLALSLLAACAGTTSKPQAAPVAKATPEAKVVRADTAPMVAVTDWASAWQARDTAKYLAAYSADFKPEKGSRAAWEKQRKERIGKAKKIEVTLSDLQVKSTSADKATATFMQAYKSDSYSDKGKKALDLRQVGGKWLITREYTP